MHKKTQRNIEEEYENIKPYLKNDDCTKELREMCSHCERYCGKEHDFTECEDMMCFKFFLAYKYLNLINSYDTERL